MWKRPPASDPTIADHLNSTLKHRSIYASVCEPNPNVGDDGDIWLVLPNLITNGSFETDAGADGTPDGWAFSTSGGTATHAQELIAAPSPAIDYGLKSVHQQVSGAAADGSCNNIMQATIDVTQDDISTLLPRFRFGVFPISAEISGSSTLKNGKLVVTFLDASSTSLGAATGYFAGTYMPAASAAHVDLRTGVTADAWNDIAWDLKQLALNNSVNLANVAKVRLAFYAYIGATSTSMGFYLDAVRA